MIPDNFSAVAAEYKRLGHTLSRLNNPGPGQPKYAASNWGFTKPLNDWEAVLAFLQRIGGTHVG